MTIKVMVQDVQPDEYPSQKGPVKQWRYLLMDASEGVRCKSPMELSVPRQDGQPVPQLRDKVVTVVITELCEPFGGVTRIRGMIEVPPAMQKAA